jgi:hypothetical protein
MPINPDTEKYINDSCEQCDADFDPRLRQAALFRFIFRFPVGAEASLIIGFRRIFAPGECRQTPDAANRKGDHEEQDHKPVEELAP